MLARFLKQDYPLLPSQPGQDYIMWRSKFLLQLQTHGNLHVILSSNYVPEFIQYPVPDINDPVIGGSIVVHQASNDLFEKMKRVYFAKINFVANVFMHVFQKNNTAMKLIHPNNVNIVQIFQDLDEMYLELSRNAKSSAIAELHSFTIDSNESFVGGLARLDDLIVGLRTQFGYQATADDEIARIQANLKPYMESLFHMLLRNNEPIRQIRKDLIQLEKAHLRKQVNSVQIVSRDYNTRSPGRDRPSFNSNTYFQKARFDDRSRGRSPSFKDNRPFNEGNKFGRSERNRKTFFREGSQERGWKNSREEYREKSRSHSPDRGSDRKKMKFNRPNSPYQSSNASNSSRFLQASREQFSKQGRSNRSPSPHRFNRSRVKFRGMAGQVSATET